MLSLLLSLNLLTWIKFLHVVSLCAALGGAIAADLLFVFRGFFTKITRQTIDTGHYLATIVSTGLVVVWLTGIAIAFEIYLNNPQFVYNEKFWVKVFIVVVLTVNASLIHGVIFPKLENQVGKRLFDDLLLQERFIFAFAGSISATSWMYATVLGLAKELNYVVPGATILSIYLGLLMLSFIGMFLLTLVAGRWPQRKGHYAVEAKFS